MFLRIFECKRNDVKNGEKSGVVHTEEPCSFCHSTNFVAFLNANFKIDRTCSTHRKEEIHAKCWMESTRNEVKKSLPAFFQNSLKAI